MPVSQSAFCWPKFVLGKEFPGHNHALIWLTLVLSVGPRIKVLSGKVFSLAVNVESPRKFPPPSVLVTISIRVLGALRVGDVRKALQTFDAAPIAPKTPE